MKVNASEERLALLIEEMGETLQIIGKIQRHGWTSTDPTAAVRVTNTELLEIELAHVEVAISMLVVGGDITRPVMTDARRPKLARLRDRWLHSDENIRIAGRLLDLEPPAEKAEEK